MNIIVGLAGRYNGFRDESPCISYNGAIMSLTENIKEEAVELGFDLVGITGAGAMDAEQAGYLAEWIETGRAGGMEYMKRNFDKRVDPAKLLEGAKSVIVVGLNYKPAEREEVSQDRKAAAGKVAHYAQYEDYHGFIKKRLYELADFIGCQTNGEAKFKVCVDSVPFAERAIAVRAGLGFVGKNHMLINPELGPEILLGEIITDVELESDAAIEGECVGCDRCVRACPTGALGEDGWFDANKCVSYLTIEHKGEIAKELAEKIGDRLFGWDECVTVCPYTKHGPARANKDFRFFEDTDEIALHEVLNLSEEEFEQRFADSPIKRCGLEGFKRNARVCVSNSKGD